MRIDIEMPEVCRNCAFHMKRRFGRDRCRMPGEYRSVCPALSGGPRVLEYDEAMDEDIVWLEWRETGALVMLVPADIDGKLCGVTAAGETYVMSEIAPRRCDGVEFRFWDRRPSLELTRIMEWRK